MSLFAPVNIFLKIAVLFLVFLPLAFPEEPQFIGKAMQLRAALYPWVGILVPALYFFRKPAISYPHVLDTILLLPFALDLSGNALNLYDTTEWFDKSMHFGNKIFFGVLLIALFFAFEKAGVLRLGPWFIGLFVVTIGTTGHVLWEFIERAIEIVFGADLGLTYSDTMDDLWLGFLATFVVFPLPHFRIWQHGFFWIHLTRPISVLLFPQRSMSFKHGRDTPPASP